MAEWVLVQTVLESTLDIRGETKIKTSSPTMRFDDTNGDGFMIHNNSDHLYIMRDDNRNDNWDDGDDDRVVIRGSGSAVNLGGERAARLIL